MFKRVKNILKTSADCSQTNQLDSVVEELTSSIFLIKGQYEKISIQETEILEKLQNYNLRHAEKIRNSKEALSNNDTSNAENLYKESEILQKQIDQYKLIVNEVQATKRKLLIQENQFLLAKDKLSSKKLLGDANVDATYLKAEISEQLMFLNESDELTKFEDLIEDANCKYQAIVEIQGDENILETNLEESSSSLSGLQEIIEKEKESKMKTSIRNQEILFERVFGNISPELNQIQKEKQRTLLNRLKEENPLIEKESRVENFFQSKESDSSQESKLNSHVNDKEDRIKSFFNKTAEPASG